MRCGTLIGMNQEHLVRSGVAAKALGVRIVTLNRWVDTGKIKPAWTTPGGQYRWDLDDLKRQVSRDEGISVTDSTSNPERPPVAAAIVTSDLGVLVGKRNDGKPPWTFIAGKIHEGESVADAAVREVKEETGLVVRPAMQEIGRRLHPITKTWMVYIACRPTEGTDVFVGDEEELSEVRWVSLRQLGELMGGQGKVFDLVWQHLSTTLTQ